MARRPRKVSKDTIKEKAEKGLTPKQEAFIRVYLETANASEAYRRVYNASKMKDGTIYVAASELLAHPKISIRIAEAQKAAAKRNEITVDKIIRELALLGFSNMLDYVKPQDDGSAYVDLSKLTRDQAAAIGEITSEVYMDGAGEDAKPVKRTKFKLSDKRAALVDLGKHLGMFIERHEVKSEVKVVSATDEIASRIARLSERSGAQGSSSRTH